MESRLAKNTFEFEIPKKIISGYVRDIHSRYVPKNTHEIYLFSK